MNIKIYIFYILKYLNRIYNLKKISKGLEMIEKDFFTEFFKKLENEIDDQDYINNLKTHIENKSLSQTNYRQLIKRGSKD